MGSLSRPLLPGCRQDSHLLNTEFFEIRIEIFKVDDENSCGLVRSTEDTDARGMKRSR